MKNNTLRLLSSTLMAIFMASCAAVNVPGDNTTPGGSNTTTQVTTGGGSNTTTPGGGSNTTTAGGGNTTATLPDISETLITTYDFSGITEHGDGIATQEALLAKFTAADSAGKNIIDSFTGVASIFAGNGTSDQGTGAYEGQGGFLRFSTSTVNGKFTLHTKDNYLINKVVVTTERWSANEAEAALAVGGASSQLISADPNTGKTNTVTFTFAEKHAVDFIFTKRAFVFKIEVYGGQASSAFNIPVSEVVIADKIASSQLTPGASKSLATSSILPGNATDKNITWSSSNTAVITVNGNTITAAGSGTSTIKATAASGKFDSFEVTVKGDQTGLLAEYDLGKKNGDQFIVAMTDTMNSSATQRSGAEIKAVLAATIIGGTDIVSSVAAATAPSSDSGDRVYFGNNTNTSGPDNSKGQGGFLRLGTGKGPGKFVITTSTAVKRIVIRAQAWSATETQVSINGSGINAAFDNISTSTINLATATTTLTVESATRILIYGFEFYPS